MSITIKATLYSKKKRPDGLVPIYIRITKDRKSNYISTGIFITENDWNNRERLVRKSNRQYSLYNKLIANKLNELESNYLEVELNKSPIDPVKLKEVLKPKQQNGILEHFKIYRNQLKIDDRYFEYKKAGTVIENIRDYLNGADTPLNKLDDALIESIQSYIFNTIGNNAKTTRRKMSTLRGFTSWLILKKLIKKDPFIGLKKPKVAKSTKARLTYDQITAIEKLNLKPNSTIWHTRNYFLYAFYNAGIRFGDLCTLKWSNIIDGRLEYIMHKTEQVKSIEQLPIHNSILKLYKSSKSKLDSYIFPLIRFKHENKFELRKEISSRNVVVNRNLKEIARLAGIEAVLSFHVARHSYTQNALRKDIDLYSISKTLGHADLQTTQEYTEAFDHAIVDKSMRKMFGKKTLLF